MRHFDCVVIGAGAAGLMCAAQAGKRGKSVALLDHANKVGKKILMSGGGRCNFTNLYAEPKNYLSNNPHFCISALRRYTQHDFIELVQKYQLEYHEKTLGQLFCDHKAKDILNILLAECESAHVVIEASCEIRQVEQLSDSEEFRFKLQTSNGVFLCRSLVIATGGLSIPTMGATGFGYEIAKQFGLKVTPLHAALVPFTVKSDLLNLCQNLAGVSLPITVRCHEQYFTEALLFTHKGVSGPAILQISNYWWPNDVVEINFLPQQDLSKIINHWQKEGEKSDLKNLLSRLLPKRFVTEWMAFHQIDSMILDSPVANLSKSNIDVLVQCLQYWQFVPNGTEGYKTAEVTRGGVNTDQVSSKTFETKTVPGLFFIGEVLDVTGWLGGYNFQWAWASGYCAAQYV